jgi:hypothetical protein
MTDKELLELAAKAIEQDTNYWREGHLGKFDNGQGFVNKNGRIWNPLTDDGDALRLTAKLNMGIRFEVQSDGPIVVCSLEWSNTLCAVIEDFNKDPYTATRRAIVKAAAEIGKTL